MPFSSDDRRFIRVVQGSSALCLGGMAALLFALKEVHPTIRFEWTLGTVLVFLVGAAVSWRFFGFLFRADETNGLAASQAGAAREHVKKRAFWAFTGLLAVGTLVAFARALHGVSGPQRSEVLQGAFGAVGLLTVLAFVWWRVMHFFEDASRRELETPPDNEE